MFDWITTIVAQSGHLGIVAPDGGESAPATKLQPDGTLVKGLPRAWRWQRMLHEGVYTTVSEIGDTENISKSYVSRILRLALLSPDIIETILAGSADQSLMLERLEQPLPTSWNEQRLMISSGQPAGGRAWPADLVTYDECARADRACSQNAAS